MSERASRRFKCDLPQPAREPTTASRHRSRPPPGPGPKRAGSLPRALTQVPLDLADVRGGAGSRVGQGDGGVDKDGPDGLAVDVVDEGEAQGVELVVVVAAAVGEIEELPVVRVAVGIELVQGPAGGTPSAAGSRSA